jgi:hypothetical protein
LPKAAVESGAMVPVAIAPDGDRPRRTDREGISRLRLAVVHGCAAYSVAPRSSGRSVSVVGATRKRGKVKHSAETSTPWHQAKIVKAGQDP